MSAEPNTVPKNKDAAGRESTPVEEHIPNPPMADGTTRGCPMPGDPIVRVPPLDPPSSRQKEDNDKSSDETPETST
ncbi:hypothetical protein FS837_008775 [Tulasnella sp. UAMH 9824]|nr:hypothetical protein FS837_008775 [Tulasnella sp. UAMH 9824]